MLWFTPKCPVEADDKLWLEESMDWLLEEFGCDAFRAVTVVLPTDGFFPDTYSADEDDVWSLVERVCSYMDVDPDLIELEFFDDQYGELHRIACLETYFKNGQRYLEKTGDAGKLKQLVSVQSAST